MPELKTKLSQLKEMMAADDWRGALKLANSFGDLGEQKADITRAWCCCTNPDFYRQIGKNPDELIAIGIRALKARYNK